LRRKCDPPAEDGFTEVVIYIDQDSWLQVGAGMTGPDGLYGSYFFRDVELNPDFPKDEFTEAALRR
jgi:hypothetical protein